MMELVNKYEQKYRILGFNDEQCECDICGKQELNGTYAIENISTGEIFRAGSTCGANMAGWSTKELVTRYKIGEKEKLYSAKNELRNSVEYIAYQNGLLFLDKENDELQRKIRNCSDEILRNEISATERSVESRREYIRPLSTALTNKRIELVTKYNLPKGSYLG